jgi:hypothetical protein
MIPSFWKRQMWKEVEYETKVDFVDTLSDAYANLRDRQGRCFLFDNRQKIVWPQFFTYFGSHVDFENKMFTIEERIHETWANLLETQHLAGIEDSRLWMLPRMYQARCHTPPSNSISTSDGSLAAKIPSELISSINITRSGRYSMQGWKNTACRIRREFTVTEKKVPFATPVMAVESILQLFNAWQQEEWRILELETLQYLKLFVPLPTVLLVEIFIRYGEVHKKATSLSHSLENLESVMWRIGFADQTL